MIIIIDWLTWNKIAFNLNTNTNREWAITFLNKLEINKDISKIHYENIYHIAQLNIIYVTSPLYHLNSFCNHQSYYTLIAHTIKNKKLLSQTRLSNDERIVARLFFSSWGPCIRRLEEKVQRDSRLVKDCMK